VGQGRALDLGARPTESRDQPPANSVDCHVVNLLVYSVVNSRHSPYSDRNRPEKRETYFTDLSQDTVAFDVEKCYSQSSVVSEMTYFILC